MVEEITLHQQSLFISEDLTRMNKSLASQGRKLKRNNLVNASYTRDGIVTIKISDRCKVIEVYHMNDFVRPLS